ncbi:hypothetical protein G7046_g424 [Stylonectria norvegica]|nr:hypothetical protein G7046_g424 [Stylonectria norvegica]
MRGILIPAKKNKAMELHLYLVALRSLQDALADASTCMDSEVLCASQLLGLHALVNSSGDETWSQHIHGSANLIKYRTPSRFESEFDQALFTAHIGPMFFESLRALEPCYLQEPSWAKVHRSFADVSDKMTERSPLAIAIRSEMFQLPGLWHDIDVVVADIGQFNEDFRAAVGARCQEAHENLLSWMEDYKTQCMARSLVPTSLKELGLRRELYGTALECTMVVKRLFSTIQVEKLQILESQVQELARSLVDLQHQPAPKHSWLFAGHEIGVAQSIFLTKEEWKGTFSHDSVHEERMAARLRYSNWTQILRPIL